MSVSEPYKLAGLAAGIGIDPPDFPVVVRGYDRQRVNAYLQSIVARLAAERDRAVQAERAAANDQPPTFEQLGAEATKVIELATRSAEVLVAQAKDHGETIVKEAEGQAADLLDEVKQQAERLHAAARGTLREAADERDRILTEASEEGKQIRTLAEDDARATLEATRSASQRQWQQVRDECTAMQAETQRLQKLRDQTMKHLGWVHTALDSLVVGPSEDEPDSPSPLDVAVGDGGDSLEATANTGPEVAEPPDSAAPESALAVQPESDQVGDSKTGPPARASARGRH